MTDAYALISKYYSDNPPLLEILTVHSELVAEKALRCLDAHPELSLDRQFVYEAAMLHDIGIFLTDAPSIHCHGQGHYLSHGLLGAELLRKEGLPRHARVAERHTGTGLTVRQIEERGLPLPHRDFLPETLEEQLVCFADKFFSKTDLRQEKTTARIEKSLSRFGEDCVERFREWQLLFG
ncbi:MAG: HDIG domain-containing protein [Prevotellaceae bacterium]|nr:HDIG domain-containing protein [Prevotellaceae bacterium]